MNRSSVNLGSGGFVSYMEDGGATVLAGESLSGVADASEYAPEYEEKGVSRFFLDRLFSNEDSEIPLPFPASNSSAISSSGERNSPLRDVFYPEEDRPFFQVLAEDYNYPVETFEGGDVGINPLSGKTRHSMPPGRDFMPTPQELRDARAHMLGSGLVSLGYGPETAEKIGNMGEFGKNKLHVQMDQRNNAFGRDIFRQAGINSSPAELAQAVDKKIFEQLRVIMGRAPSEGSFESPKDGPDVYFPRDERGHFLSDH